MKYEYRHFFFSDCSEHFRRGATSLEQGQIEAAARHFQLAYESVRQRDEFHNKYESFCGLLRVLRGDRGGLILCRDAVRNEQREADIFLNRACAEWFLNNRRRAVEAIIEGLEIDPGHPGLLQLQQDMGWRRRKAVPLLSRDNPLNSLVGRLMRHRKTRQQGQAERVMQPAVRA